MPPTGLVASVPARDLKVGDQVYNGLGPRKVIERIEPSPTDPAWLWVHFEKGTGMHWCSVFMWDDEVELVD